MAITQSQAVQIVKDFYSKYLPNYISKWASWQADIEERFSIGLKYGDSLKAVFDDAIATAIALAGSTEQSYVTKPAITGVDPVAYVNQLVPSEVINYLYPSITSAEKSTLLTAINSGSITVTDFASAMGILKSTTSTPTAAQIIKAPVQLTPAASLPESSLHLAGLTDSQQDFLVSMYVGAFGRAPDNGGLQYWANELVTDMNQGMVQHTAYLAVGQNMYKAGTENGEGGTTLQNSDFINYAYNNALGRTADSGGFSYWLNDLNAGNVGRADFLTTFLTAGNEHERDANYLAARVAVAEFAAQKHVSAAGIDAKAVLSGVVDQASAITAINGIIQKYGVAPVEVAQIQVTGAQVQTDSLFF